MGGATNGTNGVSNGNNLEEPLLPDQKEEKKTASKEKSPEAPLDSFLDTTRYYWVLTILVGLATFSYMGATEPDIIEEISTKPDKKTHKVPEDNRFFGPDELVYFYYIQVVVGFWFLVEHVLRFIVFNFASSSKSFGQKISFLFLNFYWYVDLFSWLPFMYAYFQIGLSNANSKDVKKGELTPSDYQIFIVQYCFQWVRLVCLFLPLQRKYLEGFSFFGKVVTIVLIHPFR